MRLHSLAIGIVLVEGVAEFIAGQAECLSIAVASGGDDINESRWW